MVGRRLLVLAATSALLVSLTGAADGDTEPLPLRAAEPVAGPVESHHITLVTGDHVVLDRFPDGRQAASFEPAQRPAGTPELHELELGGDLYVIPGDAAPLVSSGVLDRELFNLTSLAAQGLGDEPTGLPLIISYESSAAQRSAPVALAGVSDAVPLPSIDALAVRADEPQIGSVWNAVTAPRSMSGVFALAPGVEKVWLDARVQVALADSVPQIGAPTAWAEGFDGAGTTVAVLDTGIDTTHPDLDGKVVDSHGCTPSGTTTDGHGHGTHVASTIAGSGAASDGLRKGVAPGAALLNGKTLDDNGFGQSSWVISCMEWAVAQGADVVNMSLGGDPTDGTDPMSQAVDQLTASSGTLFAIASGNDGRDNFISAPGAATSAITVGAVSKQDALASFSNRGPRRDDFALKPDITAPGVNIIAARAAGTSLGVPVDDHYTTLQGTSMATPHVAGAAAILAQQHPSWSAVQLKAALVSAADPSPQYTVYQQGGGRVDVADAVTQPVYSTPAPLDLGYFPWPHGGEPHAETLSYVNESSTAVTLTLSLDVRNADTGEAPPVGMLTLSDTELTVPANGGAAATVTVDTTLGDYGLYSGYVTATGESGLEVTTPVGFYKESLRYTLTVDAVARDGDPAGGRSYVDVLNVDDLEEFAEFSQSFIQGSISLRVPPGTYSVFGTLYTYADGDETDPTEAALVGDGEVEVTGDTHVLLDGRTANPTDIRVQTHDAVPATDQPRSTLAYMRRDAGGVAGSHTLTTPARWAPHAAPTEPVTIGEFEFYTRLILVPGPSHTGDPFVFDVEFIEPDVIPSSFDYQVGAEELAQDFATVHNAFHANQPTQRYGELRHHFRPWATGSLQIARSFSAPANRTDYIRATDSRWNLVVLGLTPTGSSQARMYQPLVTYAPQQEESATWYRQPIRPTFLDGTAGQSPLPTYQEGDNLHLAMPYMGDAHVGHYGSVIYFRGLVRTFELYQDDELVASGSNASGDFTVAPGPSQLRIELDTDATASTGDWAKLSTRTSTTHTVSSDGGPSQEILPLLHVDYDVPVNLLNRVEAPGVTIIKLHVRHQQGAPAVPIAGLEVLASPDDGATWAPVQRVVSRGDGDYDAILLTSRSTGHLPGGHVSLKVSAWDLDGNRIDQEIIRAFALTSRR